MMTSQRMGTTSLLLLPLVLTSLCWWKGGHCDSSNPQVRLGRSVVTGLHNTMAGGKHIRKFLGIRYAEAPTELRRFQPPIPAEMPLNVDATRYGAQCPQHPMKSTGMSEDCLFLNVFVPGEVPSDQRVPVLVWLHGGGFVVGSADPLEGDELAAEIGMVVVTLNYRLGVLGFLSTGDNSSLGNYGLWDQRLALKWVQKHIRHFGGDEQRVTLGGMSAGAASTALLSLSPVSRDLFRHVIQMSGSATAPWARVSSALALESARALGQRLGCQTSEFNISTQSLVRCIRAQRVDRIVSSSLAVFRDRVALSVVDYTWAPVQDGVMVTDMKTAAGFPGPLLAGLVNNEGGGLQSWGMKRLSSSIPDVEDLTTDREYYQHQFLPTLLKQAYPSLVPLPWPTRHHPERLGYQQAPYRQALQSVQCAYHQDEDVEAGRVSSAQVEEVFGDQAFVLGTLRSLEKFSRYQPSFLYYLDHQTKIPGKKGTHHVEDQVYLFGFNTTFGRLILPFGEHLTDLDIQVARDLRQLVFNFVKTGDPNSPTRPKGWPLWTPYTPEGENYLRLSASPAVLSHLKGNKMALWLAELPQILSYGNNTSDRWLCQLPTSSARSSVFHVCDNVFVILIVAVIYAIVNTGKV